MLISKVYKITRAAGILVSCCFFLTSCYTAVPLTLYKDSYIDDGYKDREVDEENEFKVVAKGNKRTSMDRVSDYALLRSAQFMEQNGFKYFVVSKQVKGYNIGQEINTQIVYGSNAGYAVTNVVDVHEPAVGLIVTGYNEEPASEQKGKVYKTDEVLKEFSHYLNESYPKEFSLAATVITTVAGAAIVGIFVFAFTVLQ
ncbi:hypothetical protein R83H12_01578 [Fibrobacteria bacterium R8-3-H12]